MGLSTNRDLILYALIVTPIVLSFFFLRRARQESKRRAFAKRQYSAGKRTGEAIYFQWNGHSWDAYEVIGVTPEHTLQEIQAAYHDQLTRSDRDAMPFYEAAYQALVKSRSS